MAVLDYLYYGSIQRLEHAEWFRFWCAKDYMGHLDSTLGPPKHLACALA